MKADLVDLPEDGQGKREKFMSTVDCAITKALLLERDDEDRTEASEVVKNDKELNLVANKFFLLSFDKSLRKSIGHGLDYFTEDSERFELGPHERFAVVDVPEGERVDGTAPRRAVARDSRGDAKDRVLVRRRFVDGRLVRPSLHKAQDQGAIGWVASLFCDNFLGVRSTTTPDPYHRHYGNDIKSGLITSGAWVIVCEHTLLFNVRTAPWQAGGHFNLLSEAAATYFTTRSPSCPLFLMMYEHICNERNEAVVDRGTPAHFQKVWNDIKGLEVFRKKGTRVKLGRWGSWFRACRSWDGMRNGCLLVLLYMGVLRGWWRDLADMPLKGLGVADRSECDPVDGQAPGEAASSAGGAAPAANNSSASSSSSSSAVAAPPAPAAGAGQTARAKTAGVISTVPRAGLERLSVKDSNAEVKKLRLAAKHHLALCGQVLGNDFSVAISKIVLEVCQPIVSWIDLMKTACATPWGSEEWHIDFAKGSMLKPFQESWSVFSNAALLEQCGFLRKIDWKHYSEEEVAGDNKLSEVLFEVHAGVIVQCYLSSLFWVSRYPGAFVALLDADKKAQRQHLDLTRNDFQLLLKLMEASRNSSFAKALLADLQWPSQRWCMEVFYMLAELGDGDDLTEELVQMLRGYSRSWLNSLIDEDAFNLLRNNSSNQAAGVMGRACRWGNLALSDLVQKHGRTPVQVTAVARTQGKGRIASESFVAKSAKEFSLGDGLLQMMTDGVWPHPSPSTDKLVGAAWKAWRLVDGDLEKMSKCWLALLATPGTLLNHPVTQRVMGIVLGANQWLVLYLPLVHKRARNNKPILVPKADSELQVAVIYDPHAYRSMKPRIMSPVGIARVAQDMEICTGVAWDGGASGMKLLAQAAREGFRQLTRPYLDKLVMVLGMKFEKNKRPRKVDDIVAALVRHILPSATDQQVRDAIAQRTSHNLESELSACSILSKDACVDSLTECLSEDDAEDITKVADRAKEKAHRPAKQASSSAPGRPWKRKEVDARKEFSLKEARDMLPPAKGCTLSLDQVRFTRWSGSYPRLTPPHFVTKSYGPRTGLDSRSAMFHVLRTLWVWHQETTGQECPYDFPDS